MRRTGSVRLVALLVLIASCSSDDEPGPADAGPSGDDASAPRDAGADDGPRPGTPARIVVSPGTLLLPGEGETERLVATVLDAAGDPVAADVTWRSADDSVATVSRGGAVTAVTEPASVQVFAELGDLRSAPVVVLIAAPAPGVRLVGDEQVIDGPSALDPDEPFVLGSRMRVVIRGDTFSEGELVIGTGDAPIAGRVVEASVDGEDSTLVLELVALDELLPTLEIDEEIPLTDELVTFADEVLDTYDVARDGDAYVLTAKRPDPSLLVSPMGTRALGPFQCAASGQIQVGLAGTAPAITITPRLTYSVAWSGDALERLTVSGSLEQRMELRPRVTGAFEAKIECLLELFFIRIPLGGPASLFIGGEVPVGAGFEVGGNVTLASLGADLSTGVTASAEVGVDCTGGSCAAVTEADVTPTCSASFTLPDPEQDFRFEPGIAGFLYFDLEIGNPLIRSLRLNAVKSKAGVKLSGNLAPAAVQAGNAAYGSGYGLAGFFQVGAGTAVQAFFDLLQITLANPLMFGTEIALAQSPAGAFTMSPAEVDVGDEVEGVLRLDSDRLRFLGIDNLQALEIHRLVDGELALETTIDAIDGQTEYTFTWVPEEEDRGTHTFVAFVRDELLDLEPLELAADARAQVEVATGAPIQIDAWEAGVASTYTFDCNGLVAEDTASSIYALDQGDTLPVSDTVGHDQDQPCLDGMLSSTGGATASFDLQTDGSIWTFRFAGNCSYSTSAFTPADTTAYVSADSQVAAGGQVDFTAPVGLIYEITGDLSGSSTLQDNSLLPRIGIRAGGQVVAGPPTGTPISISGELPPGTYQLEGGLACGRGTNEETVGPVSGSAEYDVTFRLMPAP